MKVLIITYYWPPAGGPGVQRWLKFAKYLPEFGIEPIIYTPENPTYPIIDKTFTEEASGLSKVKVIKRKIREPYRFAEFFSKKETKTISKGMIAKKEKQRFFQKVLLFIRGNFFIPDARVLWVKPSVRFLEKFIDKHDINTIITTGPPHSMHLIGLALKEQLNINWVADFRDPWTTIGYHKELKLTSKSKSKHKSLEKEVLQKSDHIVVTSFTTREEFTSLTTKPIRVITNGYDNSDQIDTSPDPSSFTIAHIGSLLAKRNPRSLWKVLSQLVKTNENFKKYFKLHLIGIVSEDVLETLKQFDLSEYLILEGYVTHKEARYFQKKAQLLLLIEIDSSETKCIIPGKLFEYMSSGRPILGLGPKDADIEKIIQETHSGEYYNYSQEEDLRLFLEKSFEAYLKGELSLKTKNIDKYSRRTLTERLADLLKAIN